jgi:glycosyltransferase A (GT-A) superfamily protein (DUF2064 family)
MHGREGALSVFVTWPDPGRVFPSLIRRLGAEAAAELYDAFIGDLVAGFPVADADGCLYAADRAEDFRARFPGVAVREQRGRPLGRRLLACFEDLLADHAYAVVIGSAVPDLHPRLLRSAFQMLERRDVVVGPTDRGGLYLLGMRQPRDVFRGVRWGSGQELEQVVRNLKRAHLDFGFFPPRRKVETYEDLQALRARLLRPMAPLTHTQLQLLGVSAEPPKVGQGS